MKNILFLTPLFKERIWGGNQLKSLFSYDIEGPVGECWAISGLAKDSNTIKNGIYRGKTLKEVYDQHRYLFNDETAENYPLLTKIIDASDDLSVQVHPKNLGISKTECWYILEAQPQSVIIYGHKAFDSNDFIHHVNQGLWEDLLITLPVKKGDFIYVPAGTIHAIGKGIVLLETQQPSDITYRLFDYDRVDDQQRKRDLHIEQAILATDIPFIKPEIHPIEFISNGIKMTRFIENEYFIIEKWENDRDISISSNQFKNVSVIEGFGKINGCTINKGDHFIVTAKKQMLKLQGKMTLIVAYKTS